MTTTALACSALSSIQKATEGLVPVDRYGMRLQRIAVAVLWVDEQCAVTIQQRETLA